MRKGRDFIKSYETRIRIHKTTSQKHRTANASKVNTDQVTFHGESNCEEKVWFVN